jgi:hypothetical protein
MITPFTMDQALNWSAGQLTSGRLMRPDSAGID